MGILRMGSGDESSVIGMKCYKSQEPIFLPLTDVTKGHTELYMFDCQVSCD